jgi:integrase
MKINTVAKSRSLEGGILVYNRASNDTWVVMWRTSLARRYRSFKTLAQANYFAAELQRERRMNGAQPTPSLLSADEAKVWHELRVLIGGTPLSEVVEALKERRERMGGRQLEVLVDDFLRMRKDEGVRGWLHTNQTLYLRRFVRAIGPLKPGNAIEPDDVRKWVGNLKSEGYSIKTVKHHLSVISLFFNRALAEGWVNRNPCKAVQMPKDEPAGEVSVLSAADTAKLFEANKDRRVAVYMALEAFAGLRFSSAFRLDRSDINLEEKTILLPAAKHKTGRRYLLENLPENVWAWIKNASLIKDPNWVRRPWCMGRVLYDREKNEAFKRAGVPRSPNILRHSFCSYHVAKHQDAAKTALLMQHANQAMIYRHYRGVASQVDAERYFSIVP